MNNWLSYFEHNRNSRHVIDWDHVLELPPRMRGPLIRSLQRFQVGESGEGRHLRRQAATAGDPVYEAAIDLFIKEEQEHARLMARILKQLGAPLLKRHWSDACFVLLRRLFGLHHELLVLLMPEIIARRYFRALRDGGSDPLLRAVCAQILHDEEGHVAFHVDYLQKAFGGLSMPARWIVRWLWRWLFRLACLVVIIDHRAILRETGVSKTAFWWDCGLMFDEVAAGIFSYAPVPALTRITAGMRMQPVGATLEPRP